MHARKSESLQKGKKRKRCVKKPRRRHNAEWEDDTIVVYFQGKQGLEMRRYMREDPIGKPEMCVAWRIPTSKGTVEWVRVFKEKMDGLPNDPVDTKAPIG